MKIKDAAAQIEKAIDTAPELRRPDPATIRRKDLENMVRHMDFAWGKGNQVKPVKRRRTIIQEDQEGLYLEVNGEQLRGIYLISYIISGKKNDGFALVILAFGVLDGKEPLARFTRTDGYEAVDTNPAHRMMMLLERVLSSGGNQEVYVGTNKSTETTGIDDATDVADLSPLSVENAKAKITIHASPHNRMDVLPEDSYVQTLDESAVEQVLNNPSTDIAILVGKFAKAGRDLLLCEIQVGLVMVEKQATMSPTKFKDWKTATLPETWDKGRRDDALRCGRYVTRVKRLRGKRLAARYIINCDKKVLLALGGPNEEESLERLKEVMQRVDNGERISIRDIKPTGDTCKRLAFPVPADFEAFYAYKESMVTKSAKLRMEDIMLLVTALDPACTAEKPDNKAILNAAVRLLNGNSS